MCDIKYFSKKFRRLAKICRDIGIRFNIHVKMSKMNKCEKYVSKLSSEKKSKLVSRIIHIKHRYIYVYSHYIFYRGYFSRNFISSQRRPASSTCVQIISWLLICYTWAKTARAIPILLFLRLILLIHSYIATDISSAFHILLYLEIDTSFFREYIVQSKVDEKSRKASIIEKKSTLTPTHFDANWQC